MHPQLPLWPDSVVPTLLMHMDRDRARILAHAGELTSHQIMALLGEQALFGRVLDRIVAVLMTGALPAPPPYQAVLQPPRWRVRAPMPY